MSLTNHASFSLSTPIPTFKSNNSNTNSTTNNNNGNSKNTYIKKISPTRRPAISSIIPPSSNMDHLSFRRFENQVAGHDGVLTSQDDALIIKPCLAQERDFYDNAALLQDLQRFMPFYFGALALSGDGIDTSDGLDHNSDDTTNLSTLATLAQPIKGPPLTEAVCIENLCHGFHRPCVLDVKLGTQLWDDGATAEKKSRMMHIAQTTTSGSIGYRITGFQVYDSKDDTFLIYPKNFGKSLTVETAKLGLALFFGIRRDILMKDDVVDLNLHSSPLTPRQQKIVLDRFMRVLVEIRNVLSRTEVRMRSASLLFIYEGDKESFERALELDDDEQVIRRRKRQKQKRTRSGSFHIPLQLEMPRMDLDEISLSQHTSINMDESTGDGEDTDIDTTDDFDDDDEFDDDDDTNQPVKLTELRLIDFAHTRITKGQGRDEGLLFGLDNLIQAMDILRQEVALLNARSPY